MESALDQINCNCKCPHLREFGIFLRTRIEVCQELRRESGTKLRLGGETRATFREALEARLRVQNDFWTQRKPSEGLKKGSA